MGLYTRVMNTITPISDEVADHIAATIDVSAVHSDDDIVIVSVPSILADLEGLDAVLEKLVTMTGLPTLIVSSGVTIESFDEDEMEAHGWVRKDLDGC